MEDNSFEIQVIDCLFDTIIMRMIELKKSDCDKRKLVSLFDDVNTTLERTDVSEEPKPVQPQVIKKPGPVVIQRPRFPSYEIEDVMEGIGSSSVTKDQISFREPKIVEAFAKKYFMPYYEARDLWHGDHIQDRIKMVKRAKERYLTIAH